MRSSFGIVALADVDAVNSISGNLEYSSITTKT
jgi:hypothetical protein